MVERVDRRVERRREIVVAVRREDPQARIEVIASARSCAVLVGRLPLCFQSH